MEDERIIDLYWSRQEQAISETESKYGPACHTMSFGILRNFEDAQECVNDTWVRAWNSMPPQRPSHLKAFLLKIVRNLSLTRLEALNAQKRGGGNVDVLLDELSECLVGGESAEDEVLQKELGELISKFLRELPERSRNIFLRRYFYMDSTETIAKRNAMKTSAVLMDLSRTRKKLQQYLEVNGHD